VSQASSGRPDPTPEHFTRLHPVTPLIKGWGYIAVAVAVAGQDALRSGSGSRLGIIVPAVAVIGLVAGFVSWWFTKYGFDGDALRIDSGVLAKRSRRVRLDRLQAVDINRPLAGRLLGVSELRLEVAGGSNSEAPLQYLAADYAVRLRAELLARAAGIASDTPEAPERPVHEVPLNRLVWSTMLSGAFVFGVVVLVALGVGLAFAPDLVVGIVPSLIPGLIAIVAAIWQQLGRNFGFVLAESPDGFRIRKGLLDTRHQTVPPGRVQGVAIRQPLLWRAKGWSKVDVEVAGYAGGSGGGSQQTSTLSPVAPHDEIVSLLQLVMPETDPFDVPLDPAPRKAMWLRPIGWRRLAFGVNDRAVVVREGVLYRSLTVVPHAKTQSVRVTQGPLQRRLGLASAHVDTTPGPVNAVIAHRAGNQARDFVEAQAARARLARRADVPEQWMAQSSQTHSDDEPAT
jgi:putative membrane protein